MAALCQAGTAVHCRYLARGRGFLDCVHVDDTRIDLRRPEPVPAGGARAAAAQRARLRIPVGRRLVCRDRFPVVCGFRAVAVAV